MEAVADSLGEVAARDRELLELQAHELALVHRFAVYLESRLKPDLSRCQLTIDLDTPGYLPGAAQVRLELGVPGLDLRASSSWPAAQPGTAAADAAPECRRILAVGKKS